MKRILFSLLMMVFTLSVMAQGMTDSQVAQFIQRETKAGTSQSQIVTKLIQRGVKIDQIRRIRKQIEQQGQSQTMGSYDDGSTSDSRMRKNNGDVRDFDDDRTSMGYQDTITT